MRARHLIRVWIPKTMRIGYSQRRAVVVVEGATVDFARRPTTMIIIGIVLALVGLAYLCWLVFALAVYALPLFALCGRPHKGIMWRSTICGAKADRCWSFAEATTHAPHIREATTCAGKP